MDCAPDLHHGRRSPCGLGSPLRSLTARSTRVRTFVTDPKQLRHIQGDLLVCLPALLDGDVSGHEYRFLDPWSDMVDRDCPRQHQLAASLDVGSPGPPTSAD